jgi:5-formyltetrahydrofolate cyclo-ligase
MQKSQIRKSFNEQRKALSSFDVETLSQELLIQFQKLDFSSVNSIHIFLPIAEKKEPDTFLLIDWLSIHHPKIKIVVPKSDFESAMMTHHIYPGREGLSKNLFNILEPLNSVQHNDEIDLVLVPMLAFDLNGYRVGYGKGFYDRFLQTISPLKVGLCFFPPIESIDDVNEYDVRLDLCITPEQTFNF